MTSDLWCLILQHIKRSIWSIGYVNLKIIYLRLFIIMEKKYFCTFFFFIDMYDIHE